MKRHRSVPAKLDVLGDGLIYLPVDHRAQAAALRIHALGEDEVAGLRRWLLSAGEKGSAPGMLKAAPVLRNGRPTRNCMNSYSTRFAQAERPARVRSGRVIR